MKPKLLFGDNIDGMGKTYSKCFTRFGFETSYCPNTHSELLKRLEREMFNGVVFFAFNVNDKLYNFITECKNKHPNLKIYPILLDPYPPIRQRLKKLGATFCPIMPFTEYELCGLIMNYFFESHEIIILPEIADFLYRKRFPNHLAGFYFVCCAIELAKDNPQLLKNMTAGLYPEIALRMNTTAEYAERAIRLFGIAAAKKGMIIKDKKCHARLTNFKLITVLTEEYIEIS